MAPHIERHRGEWKPIDKEFKYTWGQKGNLYNPDFRIDPKYYDLFAGLKEGEDRIQRLHLCGWWKLRRIPDTQVEPVWDEEAKDWRGGEERPENDVGLKEEFWRPETDDSQWPWFFVPWDWNRVMGASGWRYEQAGVGWFRRKFRVGALPPGYRAILHFEYVGKTSTVWVNDEKIGSYTVYETHPGGSLSRGHSAEQHEYDITHAVEANAENTVTVRVFHNGLHRYKGGTHLRTQTGGIWQPVWIDVVPAVYAETIYCTPNLKDSSVSLRCFFRNAGTEAYKPAFRARIKPWQSYRFVPPVKAAQTVAELGTREIPPGRSEVTLEVALNDPVTWDIETPFLYHVQLYASEPGLLADGKEALIGQARFGFREFKTDTVKGQFRLNGKRCFLGGLQTYEQFRGDMVLGMNFEEWAANWFKMLRAANVTHLRWHSGHLQNCWYDTADEIGMLMVVERLMPLNYDGSPEWKASVKRLIDDYYNHPSVVTYSLGNEQYSSVNPEKILKWAPVSTKIYEEYKRWDETRPITTCSGSGGGLGLKPEDRHKWPKSDYHDNHDYIAGGVQHYTEVGPSIDRCARELNELNPGLRKPYVNGECGLINPDKYDLFYPLAKALPNMDRALYAKLVNRFVSQTTKLSRKVHNSWLISLLGLGSYLEGPDAVNWDARGHLLEEYRIRGMEQVGFELHSTEGGFTGNTEYLKRPIPLEKYLKTFTTFQVLKAKLAPLFVTCDDLTRNAFAGRPLSFKLIAINDTLQDVPEVTVSMAVTDGDKEVVAKTVRISPFTQEEHHHVPTEIALPAEVKTGHYDLVLVMKDSGERILAKNSHRLHIFGKEPLLKAAQARKVAVYLGQKQQGAGLKQVLDAQGVAYAETKDFSELEQSQVLIIGPDAFDEDANEKIDAVRKFVRNGGRLLVLCQNGLTMMPVVEGLRYRGCGPFSGSDVVTFEHPALGGFERKDFRLWNGKVLPTTMSLTPLTPAVLVAAARTYRAMNDMGMSVGEIKLGNGVYLFSQLRAVENCKNDSVAARYLNQLLRYCIGKDWTTKYAAAVTGGDEKFKRPASGSAFMVDLRPYCNMGFVDEVADDRKGGWSDQGPGGDMRVLPLGKQTFVGVPFDIIDPAKNENRSCIVLGDKRYKPYFPERVDGIQVGRRATHLYFLMAHTYCPREGKIGKFVFRYPWGGFGVTREIALELEVGRNCVDWTRVNNSLPGAAVAFESVHPEWTKNVGALVIPWENPVPEEKIESIDFISYGTAVPILVAVTGTTKVRDADGKSGMTPGYWKLDEGAGSVVADALGKHPKGTLSGAPQWVTGKFGKAVRLDGPNDLVTIERPKVVQVVGAPPPSFSISVWIKVAKEQHGRAVGVVSTWADRKPPNSGYNIIVKDPQGKGEYRIFSCIGRGEALVSDGVVNDDQWRHVVVAHDGESGTVSMWVDGVKQKRSNRVAFAPSPSGITLGKYYSPTRGAKSFSGVIDELRIVDAALGEKDIVQLHASPETWEPPASAEHVKPLAEKPIPAKVKGEFELDANTLAVWRFSEERWAGEPGEVRDASGHGHNGKARGGATTADGRFGRCGSFQGEKASVYVQQYDDRIAFHNKSFSVELWFKTDDLSRDWQGLFSSGGDSTVGVHLNCHQRRIYAYVCPGGDGKTYKTLWSAPDSIQEGRWHYLAVTRNAGTGLMALYVDAVEKATVTAAGELGTKPDDRGKLMGAGLVGCLDEVRISDIARTAEEVSAYYKSAQ